MAAYYITIGFKVDFFSITHFCKTHVRKPRCERDRGKRILYFNKNSPLENNIHKH